MARRKPFVLFLIFGLLGAAAGLSLAWAQLSGLTNRWQDLGSPPEEPVRIVAASSRGVWVETATGRLYVTSHGDWSPSTGNLPESKAPPAPTPAVRQPRPLGNVIQVLESFDPYAGAYVYTRYALRSDGRIYMWQEWPPQPDPGLLVLGLGVGALLGFFLGLWVIFYRWYTRTSGIRKPDGLIREEILKFPRFGRW